ncbi:hypothetical protein IP91_01535 [Pseudoduganella lurida]|uniref:Uncharacterized protein n=1 Tax=Pseudoduganella lurida TaxID=1036180 RepID=A0A562REC7_9BURK|nr:hypothetical protein [Pseudoduganella lurida]TWI67422.1 hypothetical protein IP91_01535 [Pseudoduganella lurida]
MLRPPRYGVWPWAPGTSDPVSGGFAGLTPAFCMRFGGALKGWGQARGKVID